MKRDRHSISKAWVLLHKIHKSSVNLNIWNTRWPLSTVQWVSQQSRALGYILNILDRQSLCVKSTRLHRRVLQTEVDVWRQLHCIDWGEEGVECGVEWSGKEDQNTDALEKCLDTQLKNLCTTDRQRKTHLLWVQFSQCWVFFLAGMTPRQ